MKLAAALGAVFVLASCSGPRQALPVYGSVPDFVLTAQNGKEFSSQTLDGNIYIADFIYTNCMGPCPLMTAKMRRMQMALAGASDVKLVSFTVDPERDTPPVLAAYAQRFHADSSRWYFLTGSHDVLEQLNRQAFKLGDVDGSLEHSTRFVLVDRKSQIRGYYLSSEPDAMGRLMDDIRALRREKS